MAHLEGEKKDSTTDSFFSRLEGYISGGISRFVAFLFFLVTIGAFYGYFLSKRDTDASQYLLLAPAVIGLLAYYDRAFALIIFALLVVFVIIL
ncbi:MAG: hypothetical protein NUV67_03040 [archaeon]|nr:hypothetical protein [archaeon]